VKPQRPGREPPLDGATERSSPAPAVGVAATLAIARIMNPLQDSPCHLASLTLRAKASTGARFLRLHRDVPTRDRLGPRPPEPRRGTACCSVTRPRRRSNVGTVSDNYVSRNRCRRHPGLATGTQRFDSSPAVESNLWGTRILLRNNVFRAALASHDRTSSSLSRSRGVEVSRRRRGVAFRYRRPVMDTDGPPEGLR
jgi:hypothetical protein